MIMITGFILNTLFVFFVPCLSILHLFLLIFVWHYLHLIVLRPSIVARTFSLVKTSGLAISFTPESRFPFPVKLFYVSDVILPPSRTKWSGQSTFFAIEPLATFQTGKYRTVIRLMPTNKVPALFACRTKISLNPYHVWNG